MCFTWFWFETYQLYLQKEANQLEKLKKALNAEEFAAATINITNREQRLENLQAQFNELTDHYKQILERVSVS